jgi:hypothetical protein
VISSLAAFIITSAAQPAAQTAPLRIVVVKGEDAVNIIQQKTAVAPVVEIRDRNNLPVAGATVTFTIGGNSAAFAGGAQTLTVVTNAAGQAAAAGLSPVASGAVQINVAAAFQGQSAIAAIAQTNVMTAAEAATASTAAAGAGGGSTTGATGGAAGGAAGGGGGISATTLGIVGAAGGGGALAATQIAGKDAGAELREFAGPLSGQISLVFSACTRVHEISATLTIEIDNLNGPFTGTVHIGGTSRVLAFSSGNCPNGPQVGTTEPIGLSPFSISGTTPVISFTKDDSNSVPGPPGNPPSTHFLTLAFAGTLSGDTITGTLTQTERVDTLGVTSGVGSTTYAVTLKPH